MANEPHNSSIHVQNVSIALDQIVQQHHDSGDLSGNDSFCMSRDLKRKSALKSCLKQPKCVDEENGDSFSSSMSFSQMEGAITRFSAHFQETTNPPATNSENKNCDNVIDNHNNYSTNELLADLSRSIVNLNHNTSLNEFGNQSEKFVRKAMLLFDALKELNESAIDESVINELFDRNNVLIALNTIDEDFSNEGNDEEDEDESDDGVKSRPKPSIRRSSFQRERKKKQKHKNICSSCSAVCLKYIRQWPRLSAFSLGVIIPLWMLVLGSLFFGYMLARVEGHNEIVRNNLYMQNSMNATSAQRTVQDLTEALPKICLQYYHLEKRGNLKNADANNITSDEEVLLQFIQKRLVPKSNNEQEKSDVDSNLQDKDATTTTHNSDPNAIFNPNSSDILSGSPDEDEVLSVSINQTDLLLFMEMCGLKGQHIANQYLNKLAVTTGNAANRLTFDWIECTSVARGLEQRIINRPSNYQLRPTQQAQHYQDMWTADQETKYEVYLSELLLVQSQSNTSNDSYLQHLARLEAFEMSIQEASGEDGCVYNVAGSAWFWFTVTTTIGYGNQAPETVAGRAMIYSLGFISILAFAAILAVAGHIINAIVDDFIAIYKLHTLDNPCTECMAWGIVLYAWMVIIAAIARNWKSTRVGIEISWRDAYWFSFLSTTSVGLGDIYLEPETMTFGDLMFFPFLFLVGFVVLSAFLQKFAAACRLAYLKVVRRKKESTFVTTLLQQLSSRDEMRETLKRIKPKSMRRKTFKFF